MTAGSSGFILDGGLATELEADGFDLNHPLWSGKVLLEEPAAVKAVHRRFLEAGADCVISASYQVSFAGFEKLGLPEADAARALTASVKLARAARDRFWARPANRRGRRRPLVAASVGPYGAFLADGSEYRGDYGVDESDLAAFHRRRLAVLVAAGPDLLAVETIPSAPEARVLRRLLDEAAGAPPAWMSFTCRDGAHISDGAPIREVASELADARPVRWVGVNCVPPRLVAAAVPRFRAASGKPAVAYPNGDGSYDPVTKTWTPPGHAPDLGALAPEWRRRGAAVIGGCCRTRPDDTRAIRRRLDPVRGGAT